jgi:hypothetical protein
MRSAVRQRRSSGVAAPAAHRGLDHGRKDQLQRAHQASVFNRALVQACSQVGGFYCLAILPVESVKRWCDSRPKSDLTALCPLCRIDALLPEAAGFPLTRQFIVAMQAFWSGRPRVRARS